MAEQHPDSYYKTPFKFSGKEMDEETGLHYFGARYYDSRSSIWLSVDPLAEKFPSWNPYNYTMQNPINLVDPTGMSPEDNGGEGDPPKKGLIQRISDGLASFFNINLFNDANKLAASKGEDQQVADKLDFNSRLIEGTTKSLEEGKDAISMLHPNGDEIEALTYIFMGDYDGLFSKGSDDGAYYLAGLLIPYVNGKELKAVTKVSMNQLNKLVKTGKAPKSITRFDLGKVKGEINHVHFDDGSALNIDGTWKHGGKVLTNKEIKFLQENGWTIPE
ncbi:RHS repeat-associated protein [Flavobacterium arsenatis]|uniref:RHS repeat-associated protein n=2 Tax=Flavobacterium arsenatis TaxID=1484332 RepID=A0ABU1TTU8_9FLAO|nr:RHS repeat-associated protein [Flavobacterium arsenatis]